MWLALATLLFLCLALVSSHNGVGASAESTRRSPLLSMWPQSAVQPNRPKVDGQRSVVVLAAKQQSTSGLRSQASGPAGAQVPPLQRKRQLLQREQEQRAPPRPGSLTGVPLERSPGTDRNPRLVSIMQRISTLSSVALFFCLAWRAYSIFSLLDDTFVSVVRASTARQLIGLLAVANAFGLLVSLLDFQSWKNQLKVLLAMNILREWTAGAFNFVMMLWNADDRAEHQGALLMNIWWSMLCLTFSRSRWVQQRRIEQQ